MIQFTPGIFLISALLLIVLPLDWLISLCFAAAFHEVCHILSVCLLDGRILRIKIQFMGCTIEAAGLGVWKQGISILAGPLGSFSLLLFYRIAPQLAICGCLQGLYNLLPLGPLDGGRLLKIMLYQFCPNYADVVRYFIGFGICILFDLGIVWMMRYYVTGVWPVFLAVAWNVRMLPRKTPCKPGEIGVQ